MQIDGKYPARDAMRYAHYLLGAPGATHVWWTVKSPDSIQVGVHNAEAARIAMSVFRDTIDGVRLLVKSNTNRPFNPPDGTHWYERIENLVRTVSALPGVYEYVPNVYGKRITFLTTTQQAAEALTKLVRPELAGYAVQFYAKPA